jgi:hypothetical protein
MTTPHATHTPGPWTADIAAGNCASVSPIGFAWWGCPVSEETRANARLIAAAPDLLAALRDMLAAQVCDDNGGDCAVCDAARAAIACATGDAA